MSDDHPSFKGFLNYKFGTIWQFILAIIAFLTIGYVWGVLKTYDVIMLNYEHLDVIGILKFYNRM